jgi:hypothetical protein
LIKSERCLRLVSSTKSEETEEKAHQQQQQHKPVGNISLMNSSVLVLVFAITNFQRYLFAPSRKSLLLPQNAYSPTLLQQDARSRTRMLAIYVRTSGVIPQNSNDSDIAFLPANDFITNSDFYTNPSNLNKTKTKTSYH